MFLVNNQPHEVSEGKMQPVDDNKKLTALAPNQKRLEITQMTVEIAVLKVGSKQVTQSIFRQLPEGNCIGISCPLGKISFIEPWGIVRYSFGEYCYKDGFHVVFEDDGKLFRQYFSDRLIDSRTTFNERFISELLSKNINLKYSMEKSIKARLKEQGIYFDLYNNKAADELFEITINAEKYLNDKEINDYKELNRMVKYLTEEIKTIINEFAQLPQLFIAV